MPNQVQGIQAAFNLYEETAYATVPTTPSAQKLYAKSFGVQATRNQIDSETLNPERVRSRPIKGNWDVNGNAEVEVSPENIGVWLKQALGGLTTTGAAAPFSHVFKPGNLPVGFILEKDHGPEITGAGRFEQFLGCRIGTWQFQVNPEGVVLATFGVRGAKQALAAAALDPTPTDNGHAPFSSFEASLQEGGAAIAYVRTLRVSGDNGLDDSSYVIGGAGVRRALPQGYSTITGEIEALFESVALYQKAINGDESSLKLTLTRGTGLGTAGNESLEIFVEKLEYSPQSPPITGPAGVVVTLPFRSYKSGANLGFSATLKNAVQTLI